MWKLLLDEAAIAEKDPQHPNSVECNLTPSHRGYSTTYIWGYNPMTSSSHKKYKQNYQTHLKHLKLKGLQPKTIDAYSRSIRRIGEYFDYKIDTLTERQLTNC